MPSPAGRSSIARATIVVSLLAVLAGCGSTLKRSPTAHASTRTCTATVLDTFVSILERVYHEGVFSERTASARYLITHSPALRVAVESGSEAAARAAARALLATGHMTNLLVMRDGHTLIDVGGAALAPLRGTLTGAGGVPIASYLTSVWADTGFLTEAGGITQGLVSLRAGGRSIAGKPALAAGALASEGSLTREHVLYQYASFPVEAYPSGALRVYVLIPASSIAALCGRTSEDTTVDTLARVANLIYTARSGSAHRSRSSASSATRPCWKPSPTATRRPPSWRSTPCSTSTSCACG